MWGGQTFSVGSDGGNDDVDGEEVEEDVHVGGASLSLLRKTEL